MTVHGGWQGRRSEAGGRAESMRPKDRLGRFGEELAVQRLRAGGLTVLDRNWRCRDGELDIVARDADTIVFCEVKSRSSARFGLPAEVITTAKARRQRALAARWLSAHRGDVAALAVRFDVVGVLAEAGRPPIVTHLTAVL
jgi:putative endonuclease